MHDVDLEKNIEQQNKENLSTAHDNDEKPEIEENNFPEEEAESISIDKQLKK